LSSEYPPLTCAEVKTLLLFLGFLERPRKKGTSHENFVGTFRGKFWKVTVDCPKAPFSPDLITSMSRQAGLTKKEFYAAHRRTKPVDWT
jgi:predicted RNA binding protein YcfA (HicA-like mRNA interferase family)